VVECKLCGGWFYKLGGSHLTSIHGISSYEYLMKFPSSRVCSDEYIKSQSEDTIKWWGENREEGTKTNRMRWTEEERKLASERTLTLYKDKPGYYDKVVKGLAESTEIRWSIPGARERAAEITSRSAKAVWNSYSPEQKESRLQSSLHNPEVNGKGFSKIEEELFHHIDEFFPGVFKWNRHKEKCIGGRFPDIYSDEFKLVIECFGYYWHWRPDAEELKVAHYKGYGWDCIVVWVSNDLDMIAQLHEVGEKIVELTGIEKVRIGALA